MNPLFDGGLMKTVSGTLVEDGEDQVSAMNLRVRTFSDAGEFGDAFDEDDDSCSGESAYTMQTGYTGVMTALGGDLEKDHARNSTWSEFITDDTRRHSKKMESLKMEDLTDDSYSGSSLVVEQASLFESYKTNVGPDALRSRESRIYKSTIGHARGHAGALIDFDIADYESSSRHSLESDDSDDRRIGKERQDEVIELTDMQTYIKQQTERTGKSPMRSRQSRVMSESSSGKGLLPTESLYSTSQAQIDEANSDAASISTSSGEGNAVDPRKRSSVLNWGDDAGILALESEGLWQYSAEVGKWVEFPESISDQLDSSVAQDATELVFVMNSEPYRALLTEYILHNITTKQTYQIRYPNGRSGASRTPPKRKKAKQTQRLQHERNITKTSAGRSSVHRAPLLNQYSTTISMEEDAPRIENLRSALKTPLSKGQDNGITEENSMANALEDSCSSNYGYDSDSSSTEAPPHQAPPQEYTEFEGYVNNLRKINFFPPKENPDYDRKFDEAIKRFKTRFPGSPVPRSSHAIRKPQLADQGSTPISKTETNLSFDHQD